MTEWTILAEAHDALRTAVGGLTDADWSKPTPCDAWTVTQVVQHAVGDQHAWAWAVTGEQTTTENPFDPSGKIEEDVATYLERALETSTRAWSTIDPDRADAPTPLPIGALPAPQAAAACALDAAVHAWDIAIGSGRPSPLSPELAGRLLEAARIIADPLRGFAFQAALPAEPGDDDLAVLLRHLGRDPHWSA